MPAGMTLLMKALGEALPPEPLRREWTDRLVSEIASRAGAREGTLQGSPAPYSVSFPLPDGDHLSAAGPGDCDTRRFRLRLGWLEDEGLEGLLAWAATLGDDPVRVGTCRGALLLEGAILGPTLTQRWNRSVSYERLYEEASHSRREATLKFYTPTTLERDGHPYPLPDPGRIFVGYLTAWNRFSGIGLAPGMRETMAGRLLLTDFRIQKRRSEADEGPVPGFIGSATFQLAGRHPESILKGLNALADYAFFCGTGTGREYGKGLTRRIRRGEGRQGG